MERLYNYKLFTIYRDVNPKRKTVLNYVIAQNLYTEIARFLTLDDCKIFFITICRDTYGNELDFSNIEFFHTKIPA
jgi:hypothetical protein